MGVYPRKPVGRITVFDVQEEIAFCKVDFRDCPALFPAGASLEGIPLGSISHLIPSPTFGGAPPSSELTPVAQLNQAILATPAEAPMVVAVFSVNEFGALLEMRGTAFVNRALAQLFSSLRETLPSGTIIGQLQGAELGALIPINRDQAHDAVRTTIADAARRCEGLAAFKVGIFLDPALPAEPVEGDKSSLTREYAIECARYAAAFASNKDERIEVFTPMTAAGNFLT